MKKFTLLFVALLAVTLSQAQITLEGRIKGYLFGGSQESNRYMYVYGDILLAAYGETTKEDCFNCYQVYDAHNLTLLGEFELYSSSICISRGYFTKDNQVVYLDVKETNNHFCLFALDGGKEMFDFGELDLSSPPVIITLNDNSCRLLIYHDIDDARYTDIYRLPGNGTSTGVNNVPAKRFAAPYPNPTHGTINLPYELSTITGQMQIFDVNGRLMETRLLSKQNKMLELNTTNYPAGLYFYEVEGTSQSFLVE